jgi:Zn-dependent M16 (insulinase) family peptidase
MLLQDIIQILNNKLESLKAKKNIAVASGELEQVYKLDSEISETLDTLNQLKTLI